MPPPLLIPPSPPHLHRRQCPNCGEVYEESTPECSNATFRIKLDAPEVALTNATGPEVLRFMNDVKKVDANDHVDQKNQTIVRTSGSEPGCCSRLMQPNPEDAAY